MANNSSGSPSQPAPETASLVIGIKEAVVWLGGSLASITAIFYASGYLITRAHMSMLGLSGVLDLDHQDIVQQGRNFFLVVAYISVSELALPLLAVMGLLVIPPMVLQRLPGNRAQRWWGQVCGRLPGFDAFGWMRLLAFVFLFAAFILHYDTYFSKFQAPLYIRNLLYTRPGSTLCLPPMKHDVCELRAALLRRDIPDMELLTYAFQDLLLGFALAVTLAYLTWRTTLPWRWRAWYVAPSFLATGLYLILLPMDYGVLQHAIIYPRITLTLDEKLPLPGTGPLFLLKQRPNDLVVWDASLCKLFWIPAGDVKRAQVDGTYDLFNSALYRSSTYGEKK